MYHLLAVASSFFFFGLTYDSFYFNRVYFAGRRSDETEWDMLVIVGNYAFDSFPCTFNVKPVRTLLLSDKLVLVLVVYLEVTFSLYFLIFIFLQRIL